VILLYDDSFVPISVTISVVVLFDDNRLMIAIAVVVRTDCYATKPDPDLFGYGRERTCAHTCGNSDYQCKPANHGTSPSMQPSRMAIPRACIRSGRALAPSLSNRISACRLEATAFWSLARNLLEHFSMAYGSYQLMTLSVRNLSKIAHTRLIAGVGGSPERSCLQLVFPRFFVV
jgi:hypothetical protein